MFLSGRVMPSKLIMIIFGHTPLPASRIHHRPCLNSLSRLIKQWIRLLMTWDLGDHVSAGSSKRHLLSLQVGLGLELRDFSGGITVCEEIRVNCGYVFLVENFFDWAEGVTEAFSQMRRKFVPKTHQDFIYEIDVLMFSK